MIRRVAFKKAVFAGAVGKFEWSFMDDVCAAMQKLGIVPIMDLCHFGVPDWLENFQNTTLPARLGNYARAFAERYRWVKFYTLINEMFVTTRMIALDGVWNEQLKSDGKCFMKNEQPSKVAIARTTEKHRSPERVLMVEYGTPTRKALTIAEPLVAAGLLAGALLLPSLS